MKLTISDITMESSCDFLYELYEVISEDYDIQQSMILVEHMYRKTRNREILMEGFSDIIESIVKFFKNLKDKFKEFFKKIAMYLNSHIMELDKFCKKYKEELLAIDTTFTIKGYKYTIPDKGCPNLEPYQQIVSNYNATISESKDIKEADLKKESLEFLSDANLDKVRARILGYAKPIPEEDFIKTVRASFRDNQEETQDIEVTKAMVSAIVRESDSLVKLKNDALKMQVEIDTLLSKTILFFDKKIATTYKGSDKVIYNKTISTTDNKFATETQDSQMHSDGVEKNINTLLRLKYDQTRHIATMTTTIATERTKALNDNIVFFRKILQQAITKKKGDTEND